MAGERHPLHDLFEDQIKDLYSAENQIIKALPKMAKNSSSPQLRAAFEKHLDETRNQVSRLEQIAEELDFTPKGKKCKGCEGLIEEGKEVMDEFENDTLDAGMIGAAQRIEHYEIAAYGTARAHAQLLGYTKAARLLQQTLDEEGRADKKLSELAESIVNVEALQEA